MANISGLLGTAGGYKGTGVNGPQYNNPVTAGQVQMGTNDANDAIGRSQALINQTAPGGLQALNSQQALLTQLQAASDGQGPNPALAQLNQTTGQNVATQSALMAGQRGASANTGLIARQAAQQGAQTQQNAVGQAATMQAQQQIAARQQLQTQQQTMAGQQASAVTGYNQASQSEQQNLFGANQAAQNAQNSGALNLIDATAQQQAAVGGSASSSAGSAASMFADGGKVGAPPASNSGYLYSSATAPTSTDNSGPKSMVGKFFSGNGQQSSSGGGGVIGLAVKGIAAGASAAYNYLANPNDTSTNQTDAQTKADYAKADGALNYNNDPDAIGPQTLDQSRAGTEVEIPADNNDSASFAKGGKVPALVSPGEQYLKPTDVKKVAKGANPLSVGERIPGKAKVKGNSYANDTVPKTLESGGIVIPKSVMESKNPHWEAMKFVHATMAKNRKGLPPKAGK